MKRDTKALIGIVLAVVLVIVMCLFIIAFTAPHAGAAVEKREPVPCDLQTVTRGRTVYHSAPESPEPYAWTTFRNKIWYYDCAHSKPVRTVKHSYKVRGPDRNAHCDDIGIRKMMFNGSILAGWNPGWSSFRCEPRIHYGSIKYHPNISINSTNDRCQAVKIKLERGGPDQFLRIADICIPRP